MAASSEGVAPPAAAARVAPLEKRFVAAVVDVLLLGLVGSILGMLVGERIAPVGTAGRLWGLLLVVPYLGFFGSSASGGQTFGKTLLKLRVVDASGQPLSLARSTTRALVLATPWFFNGLRFPLPGASVFLLVAAASILVYGVLPAGLGTLLLGREARQGVHDLVVGSFVVEAADMGRSVEARTPRAVKVGAAVWVSFVAVGVPFQFRAAMGRPPDAMTERLAHLPHVSSAGLGMSTVRHFGMGQSAPQHILQLTLVYDGQDDGVAATRRAAADIVLAQPETKTLDAWRTSD
jgi:uncharacterized RDD family membrane protein YckC